MFRQYLKQSSPLPEPRMQASAARNASGLDDPKLIARATMILFLIGGTIGVLTLVSTPAPSAITEFLGWCNTATAYLVAFLLWRGGVVPNWAPPFAVAIGSVMVGFAISISPAIDGTVFALVYFWIAIYSFTFFSTRVAVGQLALAATCLVSSARISGHVPPVYWITVLFIIVALAPFIRYLVKEIVELGRVDPLTGVANRRAFDEQMQYASRDGQRSGRVNALVMLDIDHFKQYNDNRGHPDGDHFLRSVTEAWTTVLRDNDLLARFGGEEFLVLLRDCPIEAALGCADRLRAAVPEGMTCSAGVAAFQSGEDMAMLMARVDLALYQAKTSGRNKTVQAPDKLPPDVSVTAKSERAITQIA
jgi:diguanylate cyclase (GGDEF)-like protein